MKKTRKNGFYKFDKNGNCITKNPMVYMFNTEYKETYFRSKKTNYALLCALVREHLCFIGFIFPKKPHVIQNYVGKYLRAEIKKNPNFFRTIPSKGLYLLAREISKSYISSISL